MRNYVTKTFSIEPLHEATIKQVAKDHGKSTESAALRYIIDEFVKAQAQVDNEVLARDSAFLRNQAGLTEAMVLREIAESRKD